MAKSVGALLVSERSRHVAIPPAKKAIDVDYEKRIVELMED
jgi:hypothetical protein